MRKLHLSGALTALAVLLVAIPASGQATLTPGNNPQPGEANVLFNDPLTTSGPEVIATTNTSPEFHVHFTNELSGTGASNGFTVNANNTGGQAKIFDGLNDGQGTDKTNLISALTITVTDGTSVPWKDLIFDAHVDGLDLNPPPRDLTVTATTTGGTTPGTQTFTAQSLGNGNNFFTLVADGNAVLTSVTLSTTNGVLDYEQFRLSFGEGVTVTPEGSSLALLLPGLIPLGFILRRRRSNKA